MNEAAGSYQPIYLTDIIIPIREHWKVVVISTMLCGILAGIIAFFMAPVYRAEVLMIPIQREQSASALSDLGGQLGMFATFLGGGAMLSGSRNIALATLGSRVLSEEFIAEMDLIPVLFEDDWDAEAAQWKLPEDEVPTMGKAFRLFDEEVRGIESELDNGLVLLTIEWTDPALAAKLANSLVEKANQSLRAGAISDATKSIAYLRAELKKTDIVEVRQAIFAVMEKQMQEIMLANVQEQYAFKIIDPAVVAEPDEFVRPKRLLIIFLGLMIGFLTASLVFIFRKYRL